MSIFSLCIFVPCHYFFHYVSLLLVTIFHIYNLDNLHFMLTVEQLDYFRVLPQAHDLGLPIGSLGSNQVWLQGQSLGEGSIFWIMLTRLYSRLPTSLPLNMEDLVLRLSQE
jgi:hypothetical protein